MYWDKRENNAYQRMIAAKNEHKRNMLYNINIERKYSFKKCNQREKLTVRFKKGRESPEWVWWKFKNILEMGEDS